MTRIHQQQANCNHRYVAVEVVSNSVVGSCAVGKLSPPPDVDRMECSDNMRLIESMTKVQPGYTATAQCRFCGHVRWFAVKIGDDS